MELPPIGSHFHTARAATTRDAPLILEGLSETLVNTKVTATIQKATLLQEAERQALIKQLAGELKPTNRGDNSAQQKLAQLLKAPRLFLLNTTIAPTKLPAGANLPSALSLSAPKTPVMLPATLQLLSALQIPPNTTITARVLSGGNLSIATEGINSTDPVTKHTTAKTSINNSINIGDNRQTPKQLIESGLRQYLPYKQSAARSDSIIQTLLLKLEVLPAQTRYALIDQNLLSLLTKITPNTTKANQPLHATHIKTAINNSGVFLEAKLQKNLTTNNLSIKGAPSISHTASTSSINNIKASPANITTDKKTLLLQTLDSAFKATGEVQLNAARPSSEKSSTNATIQRLLSSAATHIRMTESLVSTLSNLARGQLAGPQKMGEIRQQVARLVAAAAALGIAHISSQQLQKLLAIVNDGAPAQQNSAFDFSLKVQEQIIPVSLMFEDRTLDKHEEKEDTQHSERKSSDTISQWFVYLEVELNSLDKLAAEISVTGSSVKTKIWCDSDGLTNRAIHRIDRLKDRLVSDGLDIESITVEHGKPPKREQRIQHSLVDIRT